MERSLALALAHVKIRPMDESEGAGRGAMSAIAVAALALLGLAFSWTPAADRLDSALLDAQWSILRKFDTRPAPDDIIIVGIDEATMRAVPEPPGLWHEPLGRVLVRIASAKPRAIGFDLALPDRSFDAFRPGADRVLMVALAAARQSAPLVAALTIDARTRAARPIHTPFMAVLGEEGLGIGIVAREADGVTRRFSLVLPTEDGGFPTFAGRLCRALSKRCGDGYINYALGPALRLVPFRQVLQTQDTQLLEKLFRDRIVLVGDVQAFSDRIAVPVNLAGWESAGPDSPGVVVHAQSLRTALNDAAPQDASRPTILLFVTLAAFLLLMRDWRMALITAGLGAAVLLLAGVMALRAGVVLPIAPALLTLALAWVACLAETVMSRRRNRPPGWRG
jgi:adenylate cyclase